MIFAEKGNRVTQINESDIPRYVERGFRIVDAMGTVLRDTVPTDVPNLKLAYMKHVEEIDRLHAQVAELRKQLDELEATIKKPSKVAKSEVTEEEVSKVVEEPKEESKPQTRKRTKKAE